TMTKAINVMSKANAVRYGANAIERINDLPISNKAKKIAGKRLEVIDWEIDGIEHTITAKLGKRKYTIALENAYLMGEIKLKHTLRKLCGALTVYLNLSALRLC